MLEERPFSLYSKPTTSALQLQWLPWLLENCKLIEIERLVLESNDFYVYKQNLHFDVSQSKFWLSTTKFSHCIILMNFHIQDQ